MRPSSQTDTSSNEVCRKKCLFSPPLNSPNSTLSLRLLQSYAKLVNPPSKFILSLRLMQSYAKLIHLLNSACSGVRPLRPPFAVKGGSPVDQNSQLTAWFTTIILECFVTKHTPQNSQPLPVCSIIRPPFSADPACSRSEHARKQGAWNTVRAEIPISDLAQACILHATPNFFKPKLILEALWKTCSRRAHATSAPPRALLSSTFVNDPV